MNPKKTSLDEENDTLELIEQVWIHIYEPGLRKTFVANGADAKSLEHVLGRLHSVYLSLAPFIQHKFDTSGDPGLAHQVATFVANVTGRYLREVGYREAFIYQAGLSGHLAGIEAIGRLTPGSTQ